MITVIGLGFVGLTTALGFCEKGHKVFGYDIDTKKTAQLKEGKIPFYEPYLEEKLNQHMGDNFLIVDKLKDAISNSEIIFICVGTPNKNDGSTDLSYIFDSIRETTSFMKKNEYKVFVLKSTIPPSTTKNSIKPFIESLGFNVGEDLGLANNPEFLREGFAWEDFMNPDRIVIGHEDDKSGTKVEGIYQSFDAPIFRTTLNTGEFIKYLSNTLLSTLISFANEQSLIAKSIGDINIKKAFEILHLDKRWYGSPGSMTSYVYPGCGFGGYCLPKDTAALINQSLKSSYSPEILQSSLKVNAAIKDSVVEDVAGKVKKNEAIGILGLAFKPNSNDIRDTPAKAIIEGLIKKGYKKIIAYDPMAASEFRDAYGLSIEYSPSLQSLLSKVNYVVIITAWDEFIESEDLIKSKQVLDYRYLYNSEL